MIEFKRDPETGQLIGYEDGVEIGPIVTMYELIDR